MLPRVPLKKLSTQMTLAPSAKRRSHRCEPRKPEPPVTRTRLSRCIVIPRPANQEGGILLAQGDTPSHQDLTGRPHRCTPNAGRAAILRRGPNQPAWSGGNGPAKRYTERAVDFTSDQN